MMRVLISGLIFILSAVTGFSQGEYGPVSLFNGKDVEHWKMVGEEEPGFEVKEGVISTTVQNGSNLFTKKSYGNYILRLEYLLSEVGNSGVLIRSDPANAWATGVEIQLLAPWTPYRDDLHCTGSLYGHVAVTNRPDETTGIWHQMEILCDRQFIRISVDGEMITEVNIDTVKSMQDKYLEGSVGLQSNHSHPTEFARFRNIEILDLDENPEYVLNGFTATDGPVRTQAYKAAADLGSVMIGDMVSMLDSDDPVLQKGGRQVLFDITAQATDPEMKKCFHNGVKQALRNSRRSAKTEMSLQYIDWLIYVM